MLYPLRRLLERLAERDRHALAQTDDGVARETQAELPVAAGSKTSKQMGHAASSAFVPAALPEKGSGGEGDTGTVGGDCPLGGCRVPVGGGGGGEGVVARGLKKVEMLGVDFAAAADARDRFLRALPATLIFSSSGLELSWSRSSSSSSSLSSPGASSGRKSSSGSASMSCLTSCFGCALFSDTRLEPRLLFFFGGISSDRPAERARAMSDWVSHHRTIARHGHRASSRLWTNYRRMGVVPGQTIGEKWSKKSVTVVKRGGRRADLWPLLCRNPRMCSDRWLKHGHREDPDRSSGAIPSHSADAMRATCPLGARREKAGVSYVHQ